MPNNVEMLSARYYIDHTPFSYRFHAFKSSIVSAKLLMKLDVKVNGMSSRGITIQETAQFPAR
jgi:hypothetical protein